MVASYIKGISNLSRLARRHFRGAVAATILLTLLWLTHDYFPWNGRMILEKECYSDDVIKRNALQLSDNGINIFSYDYYLKRTNSSSKKNDGGIDHYDSEHLLRKSECVDIMDPMKVSRSLKICIYDPSKDLVVSRHLKTHGSWEKENIVEMVKALQMNPRIVLVDLGSNIGAFTLQAAVRGARVLAVDALLSNHVLLQRSLVHNHLMCNVSLLHNALHGHRHTMRITVNPSNIGGSVITDIPDFRRGKIPPSQQVEAICLDDLAPLVAGNDVFLKMDLEGSEVDVLHCAHRFFTQANVKVLLMEWVGYRHNARDSMSIKQFLTSHGMVPTWGVDRDRTIDLDASHAWPDNVFWMKV